MPGFLLSDDITNPRRIREKQDPRLL